MVHLDEKQKFQINLTIWYIVGHFIRKDQHFLAKTLLFISTKIMWNK